MPCQSHLLLRQLQSLCCTKLCRLASHSSQHFVPARQRVCVAVLPSKRHPHLRSRSTLVGPVSSHSEQQATLSRPAASELPRLQQVVAPVLRELEEQLGPFSASPTLSPPPPLVVIISGPSGVGKDAVINRLRTRRGDIHFVITATSRPKREGEVHGVDYFFVSKEQFEEWIQNNALLEHAVVYGDYKGIPRQQVADALSNNTDVVLRIDVQGAATVRSMMPDAVSIFLAAESEAELVQRLVARKTETKDKMLARIKTARFEAMRISEFDYVVVNEAGKLEETVAEIEAILTAEKNRVSRRHLISTQ